MCVAFSRPVFYSRGVGALDQMVRLIKYSYSCRQNPSVASFQLEKPLCINVKSFDVGQCDSVSVKSTCSRQSHASELVNRLRVIAARGRCKQKLLVLLID